MENVGCAAHCKLKEIEDVGANASSAGDGVRQRHSWGRLWSMANEAGDRNDTWQTGPGMRMEWGDDAPRDGDDVRWRCSWEWGPRTIDEDGDTTLDGAGAGDKDDDDDAPQVGPREMKCWH